MSQVMRGPRATVASITTSANWTTANINSTLTVPSGNPGSIKFTSVSVDLGPAQYSKNNGTYTTFVTNDTLSVANNDLLKFKDAGGAGGALTCNVLDNTTGATVGTVNV